MRRRLLCAVGVASLVACGPSAFSQRRDDAPLAVEPAQDEPERRVPVPTPGATQVSWDAGPAAR